MAKAPAKKSFWQKITAFFGSADSSTKPAAPARAARNGSSSPARNGASRPERNAHKPETVEVTTPRLYVGNLSFEATESDLFELFNGVGQVQNAEVVTYKHNERSKGFAFVQMQTVEEAKRAVDELHDKEFLGRKLVVSGAKSDSHSRD
ncbi:MAG: RNA-binding protein [Chthoniobacterales bacterium]